MSKAKKITKEEQELELTKELFSALRQLSEESGIPIETLVERIKAAIFKAVKKQYDDCTDDDFSVEIDPDRNIFNVCILRTVVDDEPTYINEINIDEAKTIRADAALGERVPFKLSTAQFGRVAAAGAKQSIHSDIKDFERSKINNLFKDKIGEAVSAEVQKIEPVTGNASLIIDKNEVYFLKSEQIPGETLHEGEIIKVYIADILNPEKRPAVKVSRKNPELVKRLFELEIPEIYDGTVEIKSISREAGSRTKIAVYSKDANVDPVGACIGPKHSRIEKIVDELGGEKIDIIVYDEDLPTFISHALAPADVISASIDEGEERKCTVIVPNNQLSLAIGNKGQNAKLAARLTGCKIDIKPENPVAEASDE